MSFSNIRKSKKTIGKGFIGWNELSLSYLDPHTKECELEVQKIIHL